MEQETTTQNEPIWRDSPSQWMGARTYAAVAILATTLLAFGVAGLMNNWGLGVVIALFVAAGLPVLWGGWAFARISCIHYEITTDNIIVSHGVFNRHYERIDLYRLRDEEYAKPFLQRILGRGTVTVTSDDQSCPILRIAWIRNVEHCVSTLQDTKDKRKLRFRGSHIDGGVALDFD